MYTMEYYLTSKRKGILLHGTTWMNLEDVVLLGEKGRRNYSMEFQIGKINSVGDGRCCCLHDDGNVLMPLICGLKMVNIKMVNILFSTLHHNKKKKR